MIRTSSGYIDRRRKCRSCRKSSGWTTAERGYRPRRGDSELWGLRKKNARQDGLGTSPGCPGAARREAGIVAVGRRPARTTGRCVVAPDEGNARGNLQDQTDPDVRVE